MKTFTGRLYRKEITMKNGNRFDTWFVAYKAKDGTRKSMDVTLSNEVKRGIYALLGKDNHIDIKLLCGQGKDDLRTQECFICPKTDKDGKYILSKSGAAIRKMVITSLGIENIVQDLDLPEREHEDLTSDF